jgi:hypothetical protein
MISLPARNGRRRRVMNEEVLSASSTHTVYRANHNESDDEHAVPRYSGAAGVEHHPQVTDFIPRRYRSIALLVLAGLISTTTLGALHFFDDSIATSVGIAGTALFDLGAAGSLASWLSACVLLVIAVGCTLIYSLRRHRVDDFRGRYRVWMAAAIAGVLLSANSVVGAHEVVARALSHLTGWTALRGGAAWWLVLAGLPLGWITARLWLDVLECRLAALLMTGAVTAYTLAAISVVGWIPAGDSDVATLVTGTSALVANWLLLATVASYARYVVLDAQGLIEHPTRTPKVQGKHEEPRAATGPPTTPVARRVGPVTPTEWVDGRRAESDQYDTAESEDDLPGDRKLTKAERKQLRKLKARDRAA